MPLALAGVGWLTGLGFHTGGLADSSTFRFCASLLLGIGLVSSTRDIVFTELRQRLRTVVAAVTVGVLAKAALVVAVLWAFTGPESLVLGIAVAQIDPLAVAALQHEKRALSPPARSLLLAWASFDDPVTVLLTVYASAVALRLSGVHRPSALGDHLSGFVVDLGRNLVLVVVAWLVWQGVCWLRRRRPVVADVLATVLLVGFIVVAATLFLMLGLAVLGLFFRPPIERALRCATWGAYYLAAFGLGLLLVNGVSFRMGLLLGVAAVLAHALVSVPISHGLPRRDRWYLAAGQQNGVTAMILALLLTRDFSDAVAVVAPAVAAVGLIHAGWNGVLNRRYTRPSAPAALDEESDSTCGLVATGAVDVTPAHR